MKYQRFSVTTNDISVFGGKCPLCSTPLKCGVQHECSNGKEIKPRTAKPKTHKIGAPEVTQK